MKTYTDWLQEWIRTGKRVLPLLNAWRDALVRRDLPRLDQLNAQLLPQLEQLERARHAVQESIAADQLPAELRQQALQIAQQIDQIAQVAYDIIQNELEYTHAMMAVLVRVAEPEHYSPTVAPTGANLLLNTEV